MFIPARHDRAIQAGARAFTLVEVLFAFTIFALSIGGIVYGYSQANRLAEWSAMSAAGESYALQGMEQTRSAQWNPWDYTTNTGPWSENQIVSPSTNVQQDLLDIPMKGNPTTNAAFYATNYIYVTTVTNTQAGAFRANLRQIESICTWEFPLTGELCSNTVITLRASDQ